MATLIWLSNDNSEVSGYLKAYVGFRSPNASATVSTAVTGLTASGNAIVMTATSGGAAVKWITQEFKSAVTIANRVTTNLWSKEANTSDNAGSGVQLFEYTTSEQSVFMASSFGTEASTTIHLDQWSQRAAADETNGNYTSTTIDAGNRLVIKPTVYAVGTMAAGNSFTMDYNGVTAGADGDSFIILTETAEASGSQYADGSTSAIPGGPSVMAYGDFVRQLDPVVQEIASDDASWLALKDELLAQADVQTA